PPLPSRNSGHSPALRKGLQQRSGAVRLGPEPRWLTMTPTPQSRREFMLTAATAAVSLAMRPVFAASASTPSEPTSLSLKQASELLRRKAVSPVDLTRACLQRIERTQGTLNAFITVTGEQALATARQMEAEHQQGKWRGPLHGIPIALKDNIDTAGVRTTAASELFKDRVPSEDAALVLGAIAGYDEFDPATVDLPVPDYLRGLNTDTSRLRLGVVRTPFFEQLDPEVAQAVDAALTVLRKLTGSIGDTKLPPLPPG